MRTENAVTPKIASLMKGMVRRGDRHSDIAFCFGLNQGRVADVKEGRIHPEVTAAGPFELPPPGPYWTPFELFSMRVALEEIADRATDLVARIRKLEHRQ